MTATPTSVTTIISDRDGYNDIIDIRVLFNYSEVGRRSDQGARLPGLGQRPTAR